MIEIKITYYPPVEAANQGAQPISASECISPQQIAELGVVWLISMATRRLFFSLLHNSPDMKKEYSDGC